jgi:formate dehydrogenase major subunit
MLTNPVLDPFGKIPEFKYCAVKVTAGGETPERMSFGGGSLLADAMASARE